MSTSALISLSQEDISLAKEVLADATNWWQLKRGLKYQGLKLKDGHVNPDEPMIVSKKDTKVSIKLSDLLEGDSDPNKLEDKLGMSYQRYRRRFQRWIGNWLFNAVLPLIPLLAQLGTPEGLTVSFMCLITSLYAATFAALIRNPAFKSVFMAVALIFAICFAVAETALSVRWNIVCGLVIVIVFITYGHDSYRDHSEQRAP